MIFHAECNEEKIREVLAQMRQTPAGPHVLKIGPGSAFVEKPIILEKEDRGLVIEGENTRLSGGTGLSNWKPYREKFVCAELPPGAAPSMLLVNGQPRSRARYPEEGRLKILDFCGACWKNSCNGGWPRPLNEYELTHLTVNPADIPPGFEPQNAIVTHFHTWDESTVRVKDYDAGNGILTLRSRMEHPAGAFRRNEYIILNTIEGMTCPGQWMHDRVNNLLIYFPLPEEGDGFEAEIPVSPSIFELKKGADYITFRNLTLCLGNGTENTPGLRAVNLPGLIQAEQAEGMIVDSVLFQDSAGSAVRLYRSPGFRVENCVVERMGAGGVAAIESLEAQIRNNRFTKTGMLYASAVPVLAGGYSELVYVQQGRRPEHGTTVIENNRIEHSPYCGIVCGGNGHIITGNRISSTMEVLHDGAAVYISRGHGIRISGNIITGRNSITDEKAYAIYLDERSFECIVEDNDVLGCSRPFHTHRAYRNTVRHNRFFNSGSLRLRLYPDFTVQDNTIVAGGEIEFNGLVENVFERNKIFSAENKIIFQEGKPVPRFRLKDGELHLDNPFEPAERAKEWKRMLFFGDDIIQDEGYPKFFQDWCDNHFPERKIEILTSGTRAQTAAGALRRLDTDVIAHHPDVVFVAFGINDIDRSLYAEHTRDPEILRRRKAALDRLEDSLKQIHERLRKENIDIVYLTPCAYDEYGNQAEKKLACCNSVGLCNVVNLLYNNPFRGDAPVIDFNWKTSLLYGNHPELEIAKDRVHPDARGHAFLAAFLAETIFPV